MSEESGIGKKARTTEQGDYEVLTDNYDLHVTLESSAFTDFSYDRYRSVAQTVIDRLP